MNKVDDVKFQRAVLLVVCALGLLLPNSLRGEKVAKNTGAGQEEFFIVSSVDLKKRQIVLKRPTEVTELIGASEKTVYQDERGKALDLKDLRAGDTVYVTFAPSEDLRTATRIRKGPMTAEELHRRYLDFR